MAQIENENLNAEQIKKALECCTLEGCHDCRECPQGNVLLSLCKKNAMADALSLINSQEQKINELTEENERLRAVPEQLHKEMSERMVEERKIERKLAVKRMQERLNKAFNFGHTILEKSICDIINQIAKEMLEGCNGTS